MALVNVYQLWEMLQAIHGNLKKGNEMMVIELNKKNDCLDPNVITKLRYEEDGEKMLAFWLQLLTLFHLNQSNHGGPTFQSTIVGSERLFSILFDAEEEIVKKSIDKFVENDMIYVTEVVHERKYEVTDNSEENREALKRRVLEHDEEKNKWLNNRRSHNHHHN